MRYIIELDISSKKGTEVLNYLKKQQEGKVVSIQKWKSLTPADVALPTGIAPTDEQWEEYLDKKQGRGKSGLKALDRIRKKLQARKK